MGVGVVVLEGQDRLRLVQAERVAEAFAQHEAAHGGVDVVDEAQVGADEAAGADGERAGAVGRCYRVAGEDLGNQGLWPGRRCRCRGDGCETLASVGEQAAGAQHG